MGFDGNPILTAVGKQSDILQWGLIKILSKHAGDQGICLAMDETEALMRSYFLRSSINHAAN